LNASPFDLRGLLSLLRTRFLIGAKTAYGFARFRLLKFLANIDTILKWLAILSKARKLLINTMDLSAFRRWLREPSKQDVDGSSPFARFFVSSRHTGAAFQSMAEQFLSAF